MTIAARFVKLIGRISPSPRDNLIYRVHENTVRRRLETAFQANRVARIGSYARGSAIRATSDIDLMLILKRDEVRRGESWKTSTTVLGHVRDELLSRYPRTDVVRDVHAVVVRFADNQHPVDVVPAFYWQHGGVKNYPIYMIPDGDGGWMPTSPYAHNKFIKEADERSRGKLMRVARLVKFWRRCREPHIPLNSFHLEMLLAAEDICSGPKSYAVCFNNALAALANSEGRALRDPLGISGLIPAAGTEDKRQKVQAATGSSAGHAYKAISAEIQGRIDEAIRQWDIVFNYEFPKTL
jgi:hypothetical protein